VGVWEPAGGRTVWRILWTWPTSGHDDIVDVSVVEGAVRRGDAVVTSNMTHIRMVADATGARLRIESI
jgi:hypothetical protein